MQVEDVDPMIAHKNIYMREMKNDEEISYITDDQENTVFHSKKGFLQVIK
jgi:hypothetical protein